jgi:hypothetical protein
MNASGTFEVNLQPLEPHAQGLAAVALGRMSIDKIFSGDLQATSRGEMLSAVNGEAAGYVALEQVSGELAGKEGTFVLQHYGVSNRGGNTLTLTVLPGSGTGGFAGLTGEMTIRVEDGVHHYGLEYTLEG